jgi:hypothetical protein
MEIVICKSGSTGWRARIQESYSDLEDLTAYNEIYGVCERLGFNSPEEAWEANPLIEGSVIPSDFRVVEKT